jgi:glycosyltransferase involved in cell wall biosynthesis
MRLTFLVPADCSAGGVRVTMQMGNCLLARGHSVRIAYRISRFLSPERLRSLARSMKLRLSGASETRWLTYFEGEKQPFTRLDAIHFDDKEIVVSTGVHTLGELVALNRNVLKLRYCHGLLEHEPEERRMLWLWRGPMDTIAVSPVLVAPLEQLCERPVLGVVPNGICSKEYFVEKRPRDGVGFVFSGHPIKGPEVALALADALRARFHANPCYAFGSYPRPKGLGPCSYARYPSLARARELYNRCKVWLITSRDEGFCLPILEAMACGCAVVSSRHSNALELIRDGVNGFTVPYGDVNAYVEVIGRLLRDEALRTRIAEEGFKTVARFTWENAADKMEQVLRQLNRN